MSSILTGSTIFRIVLAAVAMLLVQPAAAQAMSPVVLAQGEALRRDSVAYARRYGVPADQAWRELQAQVASVPVTDALAAEFAGRLVGIAIDHVPQFGIGVLLTGDAPVAPRAIGLNGLTIAIVFRTGAVASHSALVSAIERSQAAIRARLSRPPGMGIDVRTGELVVTVAPADLAATDAMALGAELAALAGVPVRVELAGRSADSAAVGGARVIGPAGGRSFVCTAGFAVTDGARFALATAAHCPDELRVIGVDRTSVPMPFVAQAGWGYQDVQLNESPQPLDPVFYADTAKTELRQVEGAIGRASTRAGDFVCHRGERTGYSCAEVVMTDFAPAGDLCGGACLPTWVAVEGPTCRGGDSGAPVFLGTTALGLVKGGTYRADGSCAMYYYMSVDYLPSGWTLVQRPAALP